MSLDSYKSSVARFFSRAAETYDGVAVMQRRVGAELMDLVPELPMNAVVLDLGSGTGFFAERLASQYQHAEVVALDIAEAMLRRGSVMSGLHLVLADAEAIPLATASVDLVFTNMCIQWCQRPEHLFAELGRVLKPEGEVVFSSFGPQTLIELREAWATIDGYQHVIDFLSEESLESILACAGFNWGHRLSRTERVQYPGVMSLMRELKGLGALNASENRARGVTSKGALAAMVQAYPAANDGSILATYEVLSGRLRRGS